MENHVWSLYYSTVGNTLENSKNKLLLVVAVAEYMYLDEMAAMWQAHKRHCQSDKTKVFLDGLAWWFVSESLHFSPCLHLHDWLSIY